MSEPPSRPERPVRVWPPPELSPSGRPWYFTRREFRHYKLLDRRFWRDYERWDDARREDGFEPVPDEWEPEVPGEWVWLDEPINNPAALNPDPAVWAAWERRVEAFLDDPTSDNFAALKEVPPEWRRRGVVE